MQNSSFVSVRSSVAKSIGMVLLYGTSMRAWQICKHTLKKNLSRFNNLQNMKEKMYIT